MMAHENKRRDTIAPEVKGVGDIGHETWEGDGNIRWY
jgi:hypothetical protein